MTPLRLLMVMHSTMIQGGMESAVMGWIRHMDRSRIQIDLVNTGVEPVGVYDEELRTLGVNVWHVPTPRRFSRVFADQRLIADFLKDKSYDIMHCHYGPGLVFPMRLWLKQGRRHGIRIRLLHSHSSRKNAKFALKSIVARAICDGLLPRRETHGLACSRLAGEAMFGKQPFKVIKNGINVEHFRFSETARENVRCSFGIGQETLLLGHVGRLLTAEKNQEFLLKILKSLKTQVQNVKLLLVGDGPDAEKLKNDVAQAGLEQYVIFAGSRQDTAPFYSAMDIFILPSFFEGMPVVGIEAQSAGLPMLFSDSISKEVSILDTTLPISLKADVNIWVDKILALTHSGLNRKLAVEAILGAGWQIEDAAVDLQHYYKSAVLSQRK